jgi:hypothetical protein
MCGGGAGGRQARCVSDRRGAGPLALVTRPAAPGFGRAV